MKILVVEDDPLMQATLKTVFKEAQVSLAANMKEALDLLSRECFVAAFLDIHLKSETRGEGIELLRKIRERDNYLPCVMISGESDRNIILQCLDYGAVDYVIKGEGSSDLYRLSLQKALAWRKIFSESKQSRTPVKEAQGILGTAPAIQSLKEQIKRVGSLDGPYLVMGETGTGKELVARALWESMGDHKRPFIALNCASLPENLVESELFGYERGAFTGALQTRTGLFEAANGGDIFLDEIGELSVELQAKLLRVLQEKKVRRLGSDRERPVQFRVIAATNVNLPLAVEEKAFREDLFYRLNVHQIKVPSLRERRPDIVPLLLSFLGDLGLTPAMSEDVRQALMEFRWPGNVRQLKAFSQFLVPYLREKNEVTDEILSSWFDMNTLKGMKSQGTLDPESEIKTAMETGGHLNLVEKLESIQRAYVQTALRFSEDNRSQAARILGVSRQRLSNWLNEWEIQ